MMAQQVKTCHKAWQPQCLIPWSKKVDFWKLSSDWIACTCHKHTLPPANGSNKQKRDYIIHTFVISFRIKLGACWFIYCWSYLIDLNDIDLVGLVPNLCYFCLWLCNCITWYRSLWFYLRPNFFSNIFFSINHYVICVFWSFCDTFLIKWWICSAGKNLDRQLFYSLYCQGQEALAVYSHVYHFESSVKL